MAKDVYYFSHDSNARHDPKITAMRSVYGIEGVGRFWVLVEMMREADAFKLSLTGKYVWNAYAKQMECKSDADAMQFINDCIEEFDLFASDGQFFWSRSLLRRMDKKEQVKQKRIDAANARWNKTAPDQDSSGDGYSNAMQMQCKCIENPCKCDALNKTKINEIKEDLNTSSSTNAYTYYQANIGMIGPKIAEEIELWIKDITEPVVVMAIGIAIDKNRRNWSTVKTILTDWFNQGVRSVEGAHASQTEFINRMKGGNSVERMGEHRRSGQRVHQEAEATGGIDITNGQTGRIKYPPRD